MFKSNILWIASVFLLASCRDSAALEFLSQYEDSSGKTYYQFIVADKVFTPTYVEEAIREAMVDPITNDTSIFLYEFGQQPERHVSTAADLLDVVSIVSPLAEPRWRWTAFRLDTGELHITDCENPVYSLDFALCGQ